MGRPGAVRGERMKKGEKRMRSGNSVKINGGLSAHTGFTSNLLHRQSQIHVHTHTHTDAKRTL